MLQFGMATSRGSGVRLELETNETQTRTTVIQKRSSLDQGMWL